MELQAPSLSGSLTLRNNLVRVRRYWPDYADQETEAQLQAMYGQEAEAELHIEFIFPNHPSCPFFLHCVTLPHFNKNCLINSFLWLPVTAAVLGNYFFLIAALKERSKIYSPVTCTCLFPYLSSLLGSHSASQHKSAVLSLPGMYHFLLKTPACIELIQSTLLSSRPLQYSKYCR